MDRDHYTIIFPEGDKQEIEHSLKVGDIVDINGNVYQKFNLDPKKIAYRVCGMKSWNHFKDVYWEYKLELLSAVEVNDEIFYDDSLKTKDKYGSQFEDVLKKFEKEIKKKGKWS